MTEAVPGPTGGSADHVQSLPQARTVWNVSYALFRSLRPKQVAKNGLLLVALFFSINKWWDPHDVLGMSTVVGRAVAGLLLFTALSGAVYLVNDIFDVARDRAHPVKRFRPIASGRLPIGTAWTAAVVLGAASMGLSFLLNAPFGFAALSYLALNIVYTLYLKHIVILDVMAVAAGFVIRAVAGSLAIQGALLHMGGTSRPLDVTVSPWLYVVTGLGALFIALAKRRSEIAAAGQVSISQRQSLSEYSVGLLDQMIAMVAPATMLSYTLYTFSSFAGEPNIPENGTMLLTVPFVVYGLFRYLYLVHHLNQGEAPEEILISDRPLLIAIVLWLLTTAGVLLANRLI